MSEIQITFREWVEKYQPITTEEARRLNIYHGKEDYDEYMAKFDRKNMWSLQDWDGQLQIRSGIWRMNTLSNFVTKNKWEEDIFINITEDDLGFNIYWEV